MKMRILFVFEKYLPVTDANINCIDNLCRYLMSKGVDVSVLTIKHCPSLQDEEVINGYRVHRVEKFSFFQEFIVKSRRKFLGHYYVSFQPLVEKLVESFKNNAFDIFVPVINPFSTAASVLKAYEKTNGEIKFIPHLLDPISSNASHKHSDKMRKYELEMYKHSRQSFVTDLIYAENEHNSFKKYLDKMTILPFPNFRKLEVISTEDEVQYNEAHINCAFVGFLYHKIRDSRFLLEVLNRCKDKNIILHIIGGMHGTDENIEKYKEILGDRLVIHGLHSPQSAINAMMNADILVNIGNSVINQVPSKIFDYISSGKPIINTIKSESCPTLKYLKDYPCVLNMNEQEAISNEIVTVFETFCCENRNSQIEFDELKVLYATHTLASVGDKFIRVIKEAIN